MMSVCCGLDPYDHQYYCASHCACYNNSATGPGCFCNPGFHGVDCAQQISPTVWLAVILSVGTLLVLFIAWGFRCNDHDDFSSWDHDRPSGNHRDPLLREAGARVAAAARPPASTLGRESTEPPSENNSLAGTGTSAMEAADAARRVCCVCLAKPLQVVLIPCGHACLCRRCSRKLDTCPLCRLQIQATQRFYF